jgi:hypothetical protein
LGSTCCDIFSPPPDYSYMTSYTSYLPGPGGGGGGGLTDCTVMHQPIHGDTNLGIMVLTLTIWIRSPGDVGTSAKIQVGF